MACCPTCGQAVAPSGFLVSLDTNTAQFGEASVLLTHREAEIAHVLAQAYPKSVQAGDIASRVYGRSDGCERTIAVLIVRLKRKFAHLDISISNIRRTGYRMAFPEHAA